MLDVHKNKCDDRPLNVNKRMKGKKRREDGKITTQTQERERER
jgi:hypothetical protein